MKTLSEIINSKVFCDEMKVSSQNFMDKIMKNSTIFSFWDEIVGAKFSKFCFPYAIKNSKFFVCAKSPVIVQELSLYKDKLIKKINTYSKPLGIDIKDIVFSYKDYEQKSKKDNNLNNTDDSLAVFLTEDDFSDIELDREFEKEIEKKIANSSCLSEVQKKELVKKILSNKKAQILRRKNK